jgi:endogenous inhibitor of DNA gyrase (YacG/DUF329 family)
MFPVVMSGRGEAKCPTCQKALIGEPTGPHRPFCSERCRSIDLGSWLDGAYRISAPLGEEDLDEGLPEGTRKDHEDPAN